MKRISITVLMLATALASSAVAASSAWAESPFLTNLPYLCLPIDSVGNPPPEAYGFYKDPHCTELSTEEKWPFEEVKPEHEIAPGLWCARVLIPLYEKTAPFTDSKCEVEAKPESTGDFIKVIHVPALLHLYLECAKAPKEGKVYTGRFTSKECTLASEVETGGKYLLKTPSGKGAAFKTSSGTSTLDSYIPEKEPEVLAGGTVVGTVVCKKSKGSGTIVNSMLSTATINFEDCESSKEKCTGGPKAGDILTKELSTEPVLGPNGESLLLTYAAAARTEGAAEPQLKVLEKAATTPTAEFKCGEKSVVTYNDALGLQLGALEVATKSGTNELKVNAKGGQEHVFFLQPEVEGEIYQAFLASFINPPGVTLPSGETTTQKLKGGVIGIYPESAPHDA
jgi:hypothetical protein